MRDEDLLYTLARDENGEIITLKRTPFTRVCVGYLTEHRDNPNRELVIIHLVNIADLGVVED